MSSLNVPNSFSPNTTASSAQVNANFDAIETWANGSLDSTNFTSATNAVLGMSDGSATRRGKTLIATEEARTNTAYGTLTTPDRVTGIVLPTDGVLCVLYEALVKQSVGGAGRAAIFIGANQLQAPPTSGTGAPTVQETTFGSGTNFQRAVSTAGGIFHGQSTGGETSSVTTGQLVTIASGGAGGPAYIYAAAGSYDVSVQFKSTSGSVTAKERKLWVWTVGF